jgi:23S rRNA (guanosine2251-2'-O)-methyltransferase
LLIPYLLAAGLPCGLFLSGFAGQARVGYNDAMPEENSLKDDTLEDDARLEGVISVTAALLGKRRPIQSIQIRIGKEDGALRRLEQLARQGSIPITRVSAEEIEVAAGGKTHGGVLATVGPYQFASLESLIAENPSAEKRVPLIAMIDGIEDPFNFGASVRALYAAGVDGLVLRPRNWLSDAGIVARASAGTSELIPTAIAETAAEAAAFFRTQGLVIACATDERGSVSLYEADLTRPLFLLIGGEKRGITRSFLNQADLKLRIPYGRAMPHSLGTASATAIIAFEAMRQRQATWSS